MIGTDFFQIASFPPFFEELTMSVAMIADPEGCDDISAESSFSGEVSRIDLGNERESGEEMASGRAYFQTQSTFLESTAIEPESKIENDNDVLIRPPELLWFVDQYFEYKRKSNRVGYRNIGNTCYMNATLQALASCSPFADYLTLCYKRQGYGSPVTSSMSSLFRNGTSLGVEDVMNELMRANSMFSGWQQQDAHETLRMLLDLMHEENRTRLPSAFDHLSEPSLFSNEIPRTLEHTVTQPPSPQLSISHSVNTNNSEELLDSADCDSKVLSTTAPLICDGKSRSQANMSLLSPSSFIYSSFVSETFEGIVESTVTCFRCYQHSKCIERFFDLSVPLLDLYSQSATLSNPSLVPNAGMKHDATLTNHSPEDNSDSHAETQPQFDANNGLEINGMFSMARNAGLLLGIRSVSLESCLSHFFRMERLSGEDMFHCDTCGMKTEAEKDTRLVHAPEILCLHVKRFMSGCWFSRKLHNRLIFPLTSLDMSQYIASSSRNCGLKKPVLYDLVSVIAHTGHLTSGHYTAYALDSATNRWKHFNDANVSTVSSRRVASSSAYILFYKRRTLALPLVLLSMPQPDEASSEEEAMIYISKAWVVRLLTCVYPGPINNFSIVCSHGGLKPHIDLKNAARHDLIGVSVKGFEVLLKTYGLDDNKCSYSNARPLLRLRTCEMCTREADIRRSKRSEEDVTVSLLYQKEGQGLVDSRQMHVIDANWMSRWNRYINARAEEDCDFPTLPPGPIDNSNLVDGFGRLKPNICIDRDFRVVSKSIWQYFVSVYGGGPKVFLDYRNF